MTRDEHMLLYWVAQFGKDGKGDLVTRFYPILDQVIKEGLVIERTIYELTEAGIAKRDSE